MGLIFLFFLTDVYENYVVAPLASLNSSISGALLNLVGYSSSVDDRTIKLLDSPGVFIDAGCLALEPAAIYLSSVLAFPSTFRKKWQGLIVGVFFLLTLNLLRIIGLVLIQKYFPDWFDFMHYEFFQVLFLVLAVLAWFIWIRWTPRGSKTL